MSVVLWLMALILLGGCASSMPHPPATMLSAPAGTNAEIKAQLERGNALFASHDWTGAEKVFREVVSFEPSLAEAHYNLAVTLDHQGKQAEARKHYVEAANLAPGNTVIWDSPIFHDRAGGFGHDLERSTFQDPSHKGY
ncbi:MAG: tetratricopeptide repeat protein [Nitrospira sp.]|nr:tetratricopeptide repeat protein [Nitrospira sp.]